MSLHKGRRAAAGAQVDTDSSVTFLGLVNGDTTGSTAESVTINLGTANAGDTIVLIIFHANWSGGHAAISTVKFDGTTSAVDTGITALSSGFSETELFYYDDTSGAIGGSTSIDVTWSTAQSLVAVAAFRLKNVVTGGPTTNDTATGAENHAFSLNAAADSVTVAMSNQRSNTDEAATWTDINKDSEVNFNNDYNSSCASQRNEATTNPDTFDCEWSNTSGIRGNGLAATWNQAA